MKKVTTRGLLITLLLAGNLLGANYQLAKATTNSVSQTLEFAGVVYSPNETMVSTRLMGYIKTMAVDEGDRVRKGELLFEVDPADIDSMTAQARSGLRMAESALLDAQRDYDRFKMLYERGAVTKRDLEKMELNLQMRKEGVEMAKAQLKQAEAQTKYSKVYSPIDGVVVRKMVKPAEMAIPGHPVVVLSSLEGVRVQAMIKESDLEYVRLGKSVKIEFPAIKKERNAHVAAIVPSADMATHSLLVKFSLNTTTGLIPGMYAKIKMPGSSSTGVTVPLAALTKRGGIDGVFSVVEGKAKFVPVIVRRYMSDVVLVDGVEAGQSVILYPKENLIDGTPLK